VPPIEQNGARGEVNGSKKVARGLVVARCDSAELLEFSEERLDQVVLFAENADHTSGTVCGWPLMVMTAALPAVTGGSCVPNSTARAVDIATDLQWTRTPN
jgi:hypothetical protein